MWDKAGNMRHDAHTVINLIVSSDKLEFFLVLWKSQETLRQLSGSYLDQTIRNAAVQNHARKECTKKNDEWEILFEESSQRPLAQVGILLYFKIFQQLIHTIELSWHRPPRSVTAFRLSEKCCRNVCRLLHGDILRDQHGPIRIKSRWNRTRQLGRA